MPLETIQWSKTILLRWSDFKAEPNPAAFEDASSTIKYRPTWTVNSEDANGRIQFFVKDLRLAAEFFPRLSWVREQYATAELLNHEQGHFDLAESLRHHITAEITDALHDKRYPALGKNEEQRKQFAREHTTQVIANELKKWHPYLEKKRSEYDGRTDFGQDAKQQSEYDERFSRLRR